MPGEVSREPAEVFDDSSHSSAFSRGADVPGKQPAPTTHRRVGRSMLKPPGPAVDDGPGEQAVSTEETPEDLGSAIIESARNHVKTRRGYDQLQTALDGQAPDERTPEETERLDRCVAELARENVLGARVFLVPPGQVVVLPTGAGGSVDVLLAPPKRAVWVAQSGSPIIIVSRQLIRDEIVDETLQTVACEIEGVAMENDVSIRRGGTLQFLRACALRFFQDHPQTRLV